MSREAIVATMAGLAVALATSPGCGGKTIRLGGVANGTDGATADAPPPRLDGPVPDALLPRLDGPVPDALLPRLDAVPDGLACLRGQVKANEVLWIGDSWVGVPNGIQRKRVQELARAANAIGVNEEYVDRSASATTLSQIVTQYNTQRLGTTKVKVLIMDGGTWDLYLSGGANSTIADVVNTFKLFMGDVTSHGTVLHVIYFLVPRLSLVPGIADLKPGLEQACTTTNPQLVPCHFLDLQRIWDGHPDYTDSISNIQASEDGARAIGDAIWKIMQDNCIAQ